MVGLVVSLNSESKGLIEKLTEKKELFLSGKRFLTGKFEKTGVVIGISGIGKVNAALTTQLLIDKFSPEYIINFGSVGGIKGKVSVLSYYVVEKCCQYDFDVSLLDNVSVGYIQDYDTVYFPVETKDVDFLEKTILATADRFTAKEEDLKTVNFLNCSVFDMEGAAIAQVCLANNIKLYMFKGVTDLCGSGISSTTFYENLSKVCSGFTEILSKFLSYK